MAEHLPYEVERSLVLRSGNGEAFQGVEQGECPGVGMPSAQKLDQKHAAVEEGITVQVDGTVSASST